MVQLASISKPLIDLSGASRQTMRGPAAPCCPEQPRHDDRVELSEDARNFNAESDDPAGDARIADIRSRIADGSLLSDDVINVVVDRLHKDLFPAPAALVN